MNRNEFSLQLTSVNMQSPKKKSPRIIKLGKLSEEEYSSNYISNNQISLLKLLYLKCVIYFYLNFFRLVLNVFVRNILFEYRLIYWGPLFAAVIVVITKQLIDYFRRYLSDKKFNSEPYQRLVLESDEHVEHELVMEHVAACALRVGDMVVLHKGQRVPADMILLRTNETMGTVFIRTDQLDGEIDWELRRPVHTTQKLPTTSRLLSVEADISVEKPTDDIKSFFATFSHINEGKTETETLNIENTLWTGCHLVSSQAIGVVIYTGTETRTKMYASERETLKYSRLDGKIEHVVFYFAWALCALLVGLKSSCSSVFGELIAFVPLLFCVAPMILRVHLDIAKAFYSWKIQGDDKIKGTIVRSTNNLEDLGKVEYILADKTGTLTKNEMLFKKLHLGHSCYEAASLLEDSVMMSSSGSGGRQDLDAALLAIALCHDVTPVQPEQRPDAAEGFGSFENDELRDREYQGVSAEEVALVKWAHEMGVSLHSRDGHKVSLKLRDNTEKHYNILQMFPFTSESRMMGIILQEESSEQIWYYVKGADVSVGALVQAQWLATECRTLAADGLRTLVLAYKNITKAEYLEFEKEYEQAKLNVTNGEEKMNLVVANLQQGMTLLGVAGLETQLAERVKETLDTLKAAGIHVWMVTGDMLETALCAAKSLGMGGNGEWHTMRSCSTRLEARELLQTLEQTTNTNLVIDGQALEECLRSYENEFLCVLCECTCVVVSRCAPALKARLARAVRDTGRVVAALGDGQNDVAMIQEADIGVGIEGAEGRAASLAGDVSVRQLSCLARLLLVHGRRAVMSSDALFLFIIHRVVVVFMMQAIFTTLFMFHSLAAGLPYLMFGVWGYIYSALPLFTLLLGKDITSSQALAHPELYKRGGNRVPIEKSFYMWVALSIYQGVVLFCGCLLITSNQRYNLMALSYIVLVVSDAVTLIWTAVGRYELAFADIPGMLVLLGTIVTMHYTMPHDKETETNTIGDMMFWWKIITIALISSMPVIIYKFIQKRSGRQ